MYCVITRAWPLCLLVCSATKVALLPLGQSSTGSSWHSQYTGELQPVFAAAAAFLRQVNEILSMTDECAAVYRTHGAAYQCHMAAEVDRERVRLTAPHDSRALDAQAGIQSQVAVHVCQDGEEVAVVPQEAHCHPLGLVRWHLSWCNRLTRVVAV